MATHILSIIIPTFNRYEKLTVLLTRLAGKIPEGVSLTVLDNNSTDPRYIESLKTLIAELFPGRVISIVRRNANYAMEGNMIRCYELADAEWLWMIGDDEVPSENLDINAIVEMLRAFDASRVVACAFSSNLGSAAKSGDGVFHGAECALINVRLSSLLLLSTMISNVELARRHMREAVHACHTACPHVAAILMSLSAGSALAVSSMSPLKWNVSDDKDAIHGDVYAKHGGLALKVSRLMELPLKRHEKAILYQALARCYCSIDTLLAGVFASEGASILARWKLLVPYVCDAIRFERRFASRFGAVLALGVLCHRSFFPPFLYLRNRVKKISPRWRRHVDLNY